MKNGAAQSAFLIVLIIAGGLALFDLLLGGDPSEASANSGDTDDLTMWLDHITDRPMTADELTADRADETAPTPEPAKATPEAPVPDPDARSEASVTVSATSKPAPASRAVIVSSGASRVREGIGQIVAGMSHLEVALLLGPPQKSVSSDRWVYSTIDQHEPTRDVHAIQFVDGEVTCIACLRFAPAKPARQ